MAQGQTGSLGIKRQAAILSARYRCIMLGDIGTVVLLLVQAPLIGWLCTLVWGKLGSDTPSLHFALALSAVWFGCINACREIVKERAILERERFFGLSIIAYVWSRFSVLAILNALQVVLLLGAIEWKMAVRGPMPVQLVALWLASLCGTGLGLLVSAVARSQERAVGAIPLLLLPQVLFSKFMVPEEFFSEAVATVEKLMPVRWCYRSFELLAATEVDWLATAIALVILSVMVFSLAAGVALALVPRREI